MATTQKRLQPQQARAIARTEAAYRDAKLHADRCKRERDDNRARYRNRIDAGEVLEVGGVRLKIVEKTTGRRFRLAAFLEKHKLTAAMRPFVSEPTAYEDWQVEEVASG